MRTDFQDEDGDFLYVESNGVEVGRAFLRTSNPRGVYLNPARCKEVASKLLEIAEAREPSVTPRDVSDFVLAMQYDDPSRSQYRGLLMAIIAKLWPEVHESRYGREARQTGCIAVGFSCGAETVHGSRYCEAHYHP